MSAPCTAPPCTVLLCWSGLLLCFVRRRDITTAYGGFMPKGRSTAAKLVPCPGLSVGGDAKYFGVVSNDENFSVSPHTPISCGDGSAPLSQTRGVAFGNSERESSDEWPAVRSSLSEPACSPLFSRAQCAGGFLAGKDKQPRRRVGNGTKFLLRKLRDKTGNGNEG